MSRNTARAEPTEEVRLTSCVTSCPACGQPMSVAYTKKRNLMTRHGLVRLRLSIRRCEHAKCALYHYP